MKRSYSALLLTLMMVAITCPLICWAYVPPLKLASKNVFLLDMKTGEVLYEKAADVPVPPSSMSKMMTTYMVFEALQEDRITLETLLSVSGKAFQKKGSTMFLKKGQNVRVEDLLKGVIIQSGNDAAITLAEGLWGDEETLAKAMNDKVKSWGFRVSHFVNATGWPDPGHVSNMQELAMIAQRTIEDFPDYYDYYSEKSFTFNGIKQPNRNPILYGDMKGDGLKTGQTEVGGLGVVASVKRGDRRLILAMNGAKTKKERAEDAKKALHWGMQHFISPTLFKKGEIIGDALVWLGQEKKVALCTDEDIALTLPRSQKKDLRLEIVYRGPVPAPVKKGDTIATLVVHIPHKSQRHFPLKAAQSVDKDSVFSYIKASITFLIWGHP